MDIEDIARICHEVNRTYCHSLGDLTQVEFDLAPEWQRSSALKGVEFHLNNLRNGIAPSPSASHNSWLQEKRDSGWKWGPVKDTVKREHPCFVSYENLPKAQQMKDYLFASVVKSFYDCYGEEINER